MPFIAFCWRVLVLGQQQLICQLLLIIALIKTKEINRNFLEKEIRKKQETRWRWPSYLKDSNNNRERCLREDTQMLKKQCLWNVTKSNCSRKRKQDCCTAVLPVCTYSEGGYVKWRTKHKKLVRTMKFDRQEWKEDTSNNSVYLTVYLSLRK